MSNYDEFKELIKAFSGQDNMIGVPRAYCKFMGSLEGGVFLSQLIFWSDKGKRTDGFFYKTYKEWEDETLLSQYKVNKYVYMLSDIGIVETDIKRANGSPTVHYRFDYQKFHKLFIEFLQNGLSKISQSLTDITTETTQTKDPEFANSTNSEPPQSKPSPEPTLYTTLPGMDTETNKPTSEDDTRILEEYTKVRHGQGRRGSRQFKSAGVKRVWREVLSMAEQRYNGRHWDAVLRWVNLADEEGVSSQAGFFKYMRGCARKDKGQAHGLIEANQPVQGEADVNFFS